MEDKQIVSGLRDGVAEAADALIDRFARPLIRYFEVHLPDPTVAEDMAQEVFARLMSSLRRRDGAEVRSLQSLVFTIARNLAFDVRKLWDRRPRLESLEKEFSGATGADEDRTSLAAQVPSNAPDPRARASRSQERDLVQAALRALDEDVREVIVLRHFEGMNGREIAELLGISEGTVWSRLHRGLTELRSRLQTLQQPTANPTKNNLRIVEGNT